MWHLPWPHYLRFDSKVGGQSLKSGGSKPENFSALRAEIFPDPHYLLQVGAPDNNTL